VDGSHSEREGEKKTLVARIWNIICLVSSRPADVCKCCVLLIFSSRAGGWHCTRHPDACPGEGGKALPNNEERRAAYP